MALFGAFCGGLYKGVSPVMAADTAINVFTETREVPGSAKQVALLGVPGLTLDATVATLGCRGWFTQDGRTWVVVGGSLYERTGAATYVSRGSIANDGLPVSFASNGQGGDQLSVVSAGSLFVLDLSTNAVSVVALPFSDPVMIAFLDGYGLINQRDTPIVWFSALEDFTSWDALDFFTRSGTSDNIVGIAVSRDRVWALGSKTSTLFFDSGDVDTPFVPYPGTAMNLGLASPYLLGLYGDVLYWVAESAKGQRRVVRATDPNAETISTPPIDLFLSKCSTLDDATFLIYEQDGHPFVCMTCPSSPDDVQTYAYDVREQMWSARAGFNTTTGRYTRWPASGATAIDGQVYVGDYASGNLYQLDPEAFTNNGDVLKRERTTPYLSEEYQVIFLDQFTLGTQAGVGVSSGQGDEPVVMLEVSRDGARTWADAGTAPLGAMGAYGTRTKWNKLGRFVANLCVLRVTQTDPVKTVWMTPDIRVTSGTGQR